METNKYLICRVKRQLFTKLNLITKRCTDILYLLQPNKCVIYKTIKIIIYLVISE